MQALPVAKLPEGDWLYEIKLDGYRALAVKDGKDVWLISRNNKLLNFCISRFLESANKDSQRPTAPLRSP